MNKKDELARLEREKFKDDAVMWREREAAVSGLNLSTFVCAIGPLAICLMKAVNQLPLGETMGYVILGTAPVGLLLTLINWFRTPKDYRKAKPVTRAVLISVASAVGTFFLSGYWGLMKG
jgi:hypothetical protein